MYFLIYSVTHRIKPFRNINLKYKYFILVRVKGPGWGDNVPKIRKSLANNVNDTSQFIGHPRKKHTYRTKIFVNIND
jgi:hypothetical protein